MGGSIPRLSPDVPQLDVSGKSRQGSDPGSSLLTVHETRRRRGELEHRVDPVMSDVVDPIEVGAQLLALRSQPGQIAKRLVETGQEDLEGHERSDGQASERHLTGLPGRARRSS